MPNSIAADVASIGDLEVRTALRPTGSALLSFPCSSFVEATISAKQTTNVGAGDHVKFDVARVSGGSLISLDTTTAYVNTQNTASVGRFTLTGGHTYEIHFRPGYMLFSGAAGSFVDFGVWDSDGAAIIGQGSYSPPSTETGHNTGDGTLSALFAPSVNTRIEIRFTAVAAFTELGVVSTYNYFPTALIRNLN